MQATYSPDNDLLFFNTDKDVRKFIRDEVILFSDTLTKINRYGYHQERNILITNKAVYNLKKKELKRRFETANIKGMSCTADTYEFVIHCIDFEYDYNYISPRRKKIIQYINQGYEMNLNKELPLCILDLKSLTTVVTNKNEKKKDVNFSRMPESNRVSVKEYLFGNSSQSNHKSILHITNLPSKSDISSSTLKDYKKIKVIGRGSYTRIFLVEYTPTSSEYVMKVISKDLCLDQKQTDNVILEKKLMESIKSQFIMELVHVFKTELKIYYIMPYYHASNKIEIYYE